MDDVLRDEKKMYLKRYVRILKRIERLEYKLLGLDEQMFSLGSGEIKDSIRGGIPRTLDDIMASKEETSERINRLVKESRAIRKDIVSVLDQLEDYRHVEVLELFFIADKTIEDIAEETGYTVRHTIRLYTQAIELLVIPNVSSVSQACQ
ncbi:V-type ATPase subunit a family protein [Streptococcus mutans]|nr:V-type ATPase subunit a family protein [Streptococcus mutans]MCB5145245.1 V-type ATPase subunit a family protein [Streptococcus mutans]